jgi:hypothetical protein
VNGARFFVSVLLSIFFLRQQTFTKIQVISSRLEQIKLFFATYNFDGIMIFFIFIRVVFSAAAAVVVAHTMQPA